MASEIHLQLIATFLQRGAALDHMSSVLSLVALLIGLAPVFTISIAPLLSAMALLILLFGFAQKYWAQRVAIDAQLFSVLARQAHDFAHTTAQLDTALHTLGLAPAPTTARSLNDRSRGALALLRKQALCLAAQCLLMLAVCVTASLLSLSA